MDMKKICQNQVEEAKTHKWIKGQELGYDPGDEAIHEWVKEHAAAYRERYNSTYQATIDKVVAEAEERIKSLGIELTDEQKCKLVKHICDKFTEVWVKEVATNDSKHLDEI